jgi:two-component system chemotaxis response regulator CheY
MRILIVEDDVISSRMMQGYLQELGVCECAMNGREAQEKFKAALDEGKPYALVCLDIMMPEVTGQDALKAIRALEEERGIFGLDGVKIIMTTALGDFQNMMTAFRNQCESYLVKPIGKENLFKELRNLGFTVD